MSTTITFMDIERKSAKGSTSKKPKTNKKGEVGE